MPSPANPQLDPVDTKSVSPNDTLLPNENPICTHCGRRGVIQGQMLQDAERNPFCSRNCAWANFFSFQDMQTKNDTSSIMPISVNQNISLSDARAIFRRSVRKNKSTCPLIPLDTPVLKPPVRRDWHALFEFAVCTFGFDGVVVPRRRERRKIMRRVEHVPGPTDVLRG